MNVVRLSKKKEMSDQEVREKEIREQNAQIYNEIADLVRQMKMLSKEQLWQYFSDTVEKDVISRIINELVKDKALYIVNPEDKVSAKTCYVIDDRMLDPDYYKVKRENGIENTFGNAQNFKNHMNNLKNQMDAFWIYLDFKTEFKACSPSIIEENACPFIVLWFLVDNELWEVIRIHKGEETGNLMMLSTKDKYSKVEHVNKRVILIDDKSQIDIIEKYHISGIMYYAVMEEDGYTHYVSVSEKNEKTS